LLVSNGGVLPNDDEISTKMMAIIAVKGQDFFNEKEGCLERVKALQVNLSKNLKAIVDGKMKWSLSYLQKNK